MATETPIDPRERTRENIPEAFTWNLSDIYPSWSAWEAGLGEFERMLSGYAELRGTLAQGPERLLKAFRLGDDLGQLSYRIWYYAGLNYDQDQRDNSANARRQKVQILFAKAAEARSWFTPELLRIPLGTVRAWMSTNPDLATYRFAIESTYHQQEHVLDEKGELLLSLSSRLGDVPHDVHSMLANADIKHPVITLHDGKQVTLTYGQYNALLQTNRHQPDRAAAFEAFHATFAANANTYAAVYNGVLQRDWFIAQARQFTSTLDAALHGNDIPPAVVENLVATAKAGTEPLRRYHRLRKQVLGVETYHAYDQLVPLIDCERKYQVLESDRRDRRVDETAWLGLPAKRAAGVRRALDRRVRESRQTQRRVLGARVRRAPVHAAELQRHARLGVHAGARDGALDAHDAVGGPSAVRLLRLHDFRGRSAVDVERDAVLRSHALAHDRSARAHRAAAARHRRHRRARSTGSACLQITSCRRIAWPSRESRSLPRRSAACTSTCSRRITAMR